MTVHSGLVKLPAQVQYVVQVQVVLTVNQNNEALECDFWPITQLDFSSQIS
jgi:hypothetical protein